MLPLPGPRRLKTRLKGVWSAGDFGQIARSCEAGAAGFVADLDIAHGMRVLTTSPAAPAASRSRRRAPAPRPAWTSRRISCNRRANAPPPKACARSSVRRRCRGGPIKRSFMPDCSPCSAPCSARAGALMAAELIRVSAPAACIVLASGCRPASSARYSGDQRARAAGGGHALAARLGATEGDGEETGSRTASPTSAASAASPSLHLPFTPPEVVEYDASITVPPKRPSRRFR